MNDLTPFLEVCREHVPGFKTYRPINLPFFPHDPYIIAKALIKEEYWLQYLRMAMDIARSCKSVVELLERVEDLNMHIPKDWYNTNILL